MQNLIEKPSRHKKEDEKDGEEKKKRPIIKSATDLQRLKLEKLMKNPDKPIIIPESPREKDYMQTVPSFVRNVMGSSAGAGSGEFHVYRHLRRKEYARQKCIHAKSMREQLDDEYQSKLEKNRLEADAKTAKKRAKRLKKKQRAKKPKIQNNNEPENHDTTDDDGEDEDENSSNKNKLQEKTEDKDPIDTRAVIDNNDDLCKDIAGPQPKQETEITQNRKESNQDEISKIGLNINEKSNNNPDMDKTENNEQKIQGKEELSETKDISEEKQEQPDVEAPKTDDLIQNSTSIQS